MALEDNLIELTKAIQGLTVALNANTAAATGSVVSAAEPQAEKATPKKSAAPATTKQKEEATTVASAQTSPSDEEAEANPQHAEPTEAEISAKLRVQFAQLITDDFDGAKAVLSELGFKNLNLVPANLHRKALELTEEKLNG